MIQVLFILFISIIFRIDSAAVPEWLHVCHRNDPNLNECARKNGQLAIPAIVKGEKSLQLPSMMPLKISKIDIHAGHNLHILLEDNEVFGLEGTKVIATDLQLEKQHMKFLVHIPVAVIKGHYNMNGNVLIMPIKGNGATNITFLNGDYLYSMNYTLKKRNGKEYLIIGDHSITFNTTRAYYHFDNLFGGNSALGKQMNLFLYENWEAVTKDLGTTVSETISSIITSLARSIFTKIPFNEVLPP